MTGAAVATVQVDSDRVRVTEWRFPPGAATGWHVHGMDYVVVPMTTGRLTLKEPNGVTRHADLTAGVAYARRAGVEHDVINANEFEFVFVEVELKG
ncbi:MAG: cupin domain-containing protein [Alphaproteobacteria bacterium]